MATWPEPSMLPDPHAFVHELVVFYEEHGVAILNMLSQEASVPALRRALDPWRVRHEKGIERALGHLLRGVRGDARKRRHLQLVTICDVQMWNLLRHGKRLPQADVERVLTEMLAAIGTARRQGDHVSEPSRFDRALQAGSTGGEEADHEGVRHCSDRTSRQRSLHAAVSTPFRATYAR
jgi:hypothetical protein